MVSKESLDDLKHEGVFPWSPLATRSAIAAAVLGGLLLSYKSVSISGLVVDSGEPIALLRRLQGPLLQVVSVSIACGVVAGILISLVQTRGARGRAALRAVKRRRSLPQPLLMVISLATVGGLSYAIALQVLPDLASFGTSGYDTSTFTGEALRIFSRICKLLVVASLVLAILLVFVTRLVFVLRVRSGSLVAPQREDSGRIV